MSQMLHGAQWIRPNSCVTFKRASVASSAHRLGAVREKNAALRQQRRSKREEKIQENDSRNLQARIYGKQVEQHYWPPETRKVTLEKTHDKQSEVSIMSPIRDKEDAATNSNTDGEVLEVEEAAPTPVGRQPPPKHFVCVCRVAIRPRLANRFTNLQASLFCAPSSRCFEGGHRESQARLVLGLDSEAMDRRTRQMTWTLRSAQ